MPSNPQKHLHPFHFVLFRGEKRIRSLTFYAKTQAGADAKALAWKKKGETIKRRRA